MTLIRLRNSAYGLEVVPTREDPLSEFSVPNTSCRLISGTGHPIDHALDQTIFTILEMHRPECAVDLVRNGKEVVELPEFVRRRLAQIIRPIHTRFDLGAALLLHRNCPTIFAW